MRLEPTITALMATWLVFTPCCRAEFTLEMGNEGKEATQEPAEGACSEIPQRKSSCQMSEPNVQAPSLPEPNRNVESYMNVDGSQQYVKGDDGRLRSVGQAAVELNNEAVRRMNEGRHDEARPLFEKAREIMGEAPEGPCVEETQLEKFNRNVINQNNDTVFKYDASRYDKSADRPSVQDVLNAVEPSSDTTHDSGY
ncbi:MAG: hypothetical protein K2Y22_03140 [Candidatus Obscuribacterales bacterium]|nr:hypothetical protein [Candidatus Obscuribacterales bacterium]